MVSWSQWITAHRKSKGWNKKQLAEAIGYDEHSVGDWENGRRDPGKRAIARMSELFGENL